MRPLLLAMAATLVLAPVGQAAWIDDPLGDVRLQADDPVGQAAPLAGPAYASIDLLALDVTEGPETFTFALKVADLGDTDDKSADGMDCSILFTQGGRDFRIRLSRFLPVLGGGFLDLWTRDGEGAWQMQPLADLDLAMDAVAETLTFTLARGDMADASGAAPFPGRLLEDVHASCRNALSGISLVGGVTPPPPAHAQDDLPDDGVATGTWPVTMGAAQTGHALLTSAQPFRASNGEATTFAYNVTAHNQGGTDDDFVLRATGVPERTNVSLVTDRLHIAAGGEESFTVWVSVPFAHDHGTTRSFVLELASATDPGSVGRLEVGVRYLAVPQPAGHHDTLYVHSHREEGLQEPVIQRAPGIVGNNGFLNTLDEDPTDSHDGLAFSSGSGGGGGSPDAYEFYVDLAPSLLVGIDADLSRVGEMQVQFGSRSPRQDVMVSAEVVVGTRGEGTQTLAKMGPTAATAAGDVYTAVGDLVPQAEADLVPFAPGMNLFLMVHFESMGALPADPPWLMTGSWLRLPLLDYHDPVEGMPETGAVVLAGAQPLVETPSKESPAPLWTVLAAVAIGLLVRRRT